MDRERRLGLAVSVTRIMGRTRKDSLADSESVFDGFRSGLIFGDVVP